MAAHLQHAPLFPFEFQRLVQVQFRQLDPLAHRGLWHKPTCGQVMTYFSKDPRTAVGGPPDHHAVHAVAVERPGGLLRRTDVAVADDGNRHARIALHLADQRPVRLAAVHLRPGAAVDRQRRNAHVLQPLGDLDDILRIVVPPQPRLDRHGQFHRPDDPARHLDHLRHVAHHAAARPAPGDLAHRTAEIDVNQVGSGRFGHARGLYHRFDLVAVQLDAHRPFVVEDVEFGERLRRVADQPVAGDKLGIDHIGPVPLAHEAERRVGHILHRSQKERLLAEVDRCYFHRFGYKISVPYGITSVSSSIVPS